MLNLLGPHFENYSLEVKNPVLSDTTCVFEFWLHHIFSLEQINLPLCISFTLSVKSGQ